MKQQAEKQLEIVRAISEPIRQWKVIGNTVFRKHNDTILMDTSKLSTSITTTYSLSLT